MNMDMVIAIIVAIVLLGVAGGCAFAVLKVRGALGKIDTEVEPMLDDLKAKTEALRPAVAQTESLMQKMNVTLDSLNVEMVKIDAKLDEVERMTDTVSTVIETAPETVENVKKSLASAFQRN